MKLWGTLIYPKETLDGENKKQIPNNKPKFYDKQFHDKSEFF